LSFEDRTLNCADCQTSFTFTAAEQEFYAKKGFTNDPKRCPECRQAKKQRVGGGREAGGQRQLYPAVCASCGKDTQVPFEPRNGRPVYCSDCFTKSKANS
jgi:CxxC-x17-CxxC domain-containing protein